MKLISGLNWSRLRWIARCWKGVARIWRRKIEGCRRKFRSLEHSNFPLSFTCKWPHPPHSLCAHLASGWLFRPPPLMPPHVIIPWPRPRHTVGPYPLGRGLRLVPFRSGPLMVSTSDVEGRVWIRINFMELLLLVLGCRCVPQKEKNGGNSEEGFGIVRSEVRSRIWSLEEGIWWVSNVLYHFDSSSFVLFGWPILVRSFSVFSIT